MTRVRVNGVPIIQDEFDLQGKCELCGKTAETRPYGPGGKEVCFPCGMKDETEAKRRFAAFGESRDTAAVAFVLWLSLLVVVGSLSILQILTSMWSILQILTSMW